MRLRGLAIGAQRLPRHAAKSMNSLKATTAAAMPAHTGRARIIPFLAMLGARLVRLTANGRATGGGRSVCFCEAQIHNEAGQVTAKAMGTFRYRAPQAPGELGEPVEAGASLAGE